MPKDFFVGNVSMKSCLLDGMLRFLKHAPALEIFWPKVWIFRQFSLLGERGGVLAVITCAIGTRGWSTPPVFDQISLNFE